MDQQSISFSYVNTEFTIEDEARCSLWVSAVIKEEQKSFDSISYIFCDDSYLLEINKKYLDHDALTDIITFPYQDEPIQSDIFISIDRIRENALELNVPFIQELKRVMVHGVLHLCGYDDKSDWEKKEMRSKEDYYIKSF